MGDVYAASADKGNSTGYTITDLAVLLDHGLPPERGGVGGDMSCVGNTGMGAGYLATSGAGYRHVCDLSPGAPAGLYTVDGQGQYQLQPPQFASSRY